MPPSEKELEKIATNASIAAALAQDADADNDDAAAAPSSAQPAASPPPKAATKFKNVGKAFLNHAKKKTSLSVWSTQAQDKSIAARELLLESAGRRTASRDVITAHASR